MTETASADRWVLALYVNGGSTYSLQAIEGVRRFCDEDLDGRVDLEVIDVEQHTALVVSDQVIAVPTLVKRRPGPLRRIVGDLSDPVRLRLALDVAALPALGPVRAGDGRGPGDRA
jgi:circadian clock protein KaiB